MCWTAPSSAVGSDPSPVIAASRPSTALGGANNAFGSTRAIASQTQSPSTIESG